MFERLQRRDWAGVICLGTGLIVFGLGLSSYRQAWQAHRDSEQLLQEQQDRLRKLLAERHLQAEYAPRYRALQRQGLIEGRLWDGVALLEQLRQSIPLQELRYNLSSPALVDPEADSADLHLYVSRIELQVRLRHEGDLQRLFQHLQDGGAGHFAPGSCKLERLSSADFSLQVHCQLRWHTFAAEPPDWMRA